MPGHIRQRREELRGVPLRLLLERDLALLQLGHASLGELDGLLHQPEGDDRGELERPQDFLHRAGHHVPEQVHAVAQDELMAGEDHVEHVLAQDRQELLLELRDRGGRAEGGELVGEVEFQ